MPSRGETDDLATLSRLDEATLLEELRFRYSRDKIYVSLKFVFCSLIALVDYLIIDCFRPMWETF